MPVHRHHRVVHLHIPKTAGTSIGNVFGEAGDLDTSPEGWYGQVVRDGRHFELQHLSQLELRDLSRHAFDTFDTFAVVRDPYQRLISEFHWRHFVGERDPENIERFESFAELVAAIPLDLDHRWFQYISLADRRHANLLIHLRPQWQHVCDRTHRLDPDIEIVRFEQLHDDLEPLLQRWHVAARPARRQLSPKPLGDYFTAETLAVVNQVYAHDFEWFGYRRVTALS